MVAKAATARSDIQNNHNALKQVALLQIYIACGMVRQRVYQSNQKW
jgi:hypothetical protein